MCFVVLPVDIILMKLFPWKIYKIIKLFIPIPISNYFGESKLNQNYKNLLTWAVMDTFDRLGAKYDEPWTIVKLKSVASSLNLESFDVKTLSNNANGLILNGIAMRIKE